MSNKTHKTLVIIICETRAHGVTSDLFKRNVLDIIPADLALCVRSNEQHEQHEQHNKFYDLAKYVWPVKEPDNWTDAYKSVAKELNVDENAWLKASAIGEMWLGGGNNKSIINQCGSGAILYYYRWFLQKKLEELNLIKEYDWFVITRSDFIWNIPHPPSKLLDPNRIYIPDGEYYDGVTDRHMIVSANYVKDCIHLIEPILCQPQYVIDSLVQMYGDVLNPERYIKWKLRELGLLDKVCFFPYVMYAVRENGGSTSWSIGTWNSELKYNIKYDGEYQSYIKYKNIIKTADDWKILLP